MFHGFRDVVTINMFTLLNMCRWTCAPCVSNIFTTAALPNFHMAAASPNFHLVSRLSLSFFFLFFLKSLSLSLSCLSLRFSVWKSHSIWGFFFSFRFSVWTSETGVFCQAAGFLFFIFIFIFFLKINLLIFIYLFIFYKWASRLGYHFRGAQVFCGLAGQQSFVRLLGFL